MEKSPAFQIYPKDFISDFDVQNMNMEEVGVYIYLLFADWLEDGIPDDITVVQGWLKHRCTTLDSMVKPWSKFTILKDGKRYNPRLDKERQKQKTWRQKSSEGGKKSAASRRETKGGSRVVKDGSTVEQPKGNSSSSVFSLQSSSSIASSEEVIKKDVKKSSSTASAVQGIVNLYNEHCPSLPKVQRLSKTRIQKVSARLREYPEDEPWIELFKRIEASDYATGRTGGSWRASFDWLIKESSIIKVLEGNYDNRGGQRPMSFDDPEMVKMMKEATDAGRRVS